jgi:O-antigen/teichoic acid export membrane protein
MDIVTYAEFESLLGIFSILGVITSSIGYFLVKEILMRKDTESMSSFVFFSVTQYLTIGGIILYFLYILFLPVTAQFINITNYWAIALIGTTLILSFFSIPSGSILQARQAFVVLGFNSVLSAWLRIFIAGIISLTWITLVNAIWGFIFTSILTSWWLSLYVWTLLRKNAVPNNEQKEAFKRDFTREKYNLWYFFWVSIVLAMLMNVDVVLVNSFLSKEIAGIYAWISVLAKFILFIIGAIETVFYPKIIGSTGRDFIKHLADGSIYMVLAVGGALFCTFLLWKIGLSLLPHNLSSYAFICTVLVAIFWFYAIIAFYARILTAKKIYSHIFINSAAILLFFIYGLFSTQGNIQSYTLSLWVLMLGCSMSIFLSLYKEIKRNRADI